MATKKMRTVRPFNGFPQETDANTGYVIQLCRSCGRRIHVPFNQLGREPKVCESCYSGGL